MVIIGMEVLVLLSLGVLVAEEINVLSVAIIYWMRLIFLLIRRVALP